MLKLPLPQQFSYSSFPTDTSCAHLPSQLFLRFIHLFGDRVLRSSGWPLKLKITLNSRSSYLSRPCCGSTVITLPAKILFAYVVLGLNLDPAVAGLCYVVGSSLSQSLSPGFTPVSSEKFPEFQRPHNHRNNLRLAKPRLRWNTGKLSSAAAKQPHIPTPEKAIVKACCGNTAFVILVSSLPSN